LLFSSREKIQWWWCGGSGSKAYKPGEKAELDILYAWPLKCMMLASLKRAFRWVHPK